MNKHLSFLGYRKTAGGDKPRSEPDSGNPTVRDRRGGLAETWAMVDAKRARKAETPKQPRRHLRSSAPYFYPDPHI